MLPGFAMLLTKLSPQGRSNLTSSASIVAGVPVPIFLEISLIPLPIPVTTVQVVSVKVNFCMACCMPLEI